MIINGEKVAGIFADGEVVNDKCEVIYICKTEEERKELVRRMVLGDKR